MTRWKHIAASIAINLCLGAVYAFSILIPPLEKEFGWKRIETSPAFTIALLTFALSMIPAGRLQDRKGPRATVSIGGLMLGLGMILAGYTNSLIWLYLSYGLLVGLGIGFSYGAPIATCNKWFPDKKGLATGLVVFGFGGGSIIFAPLWSFLIESYGWRFTFILTGIIFMALTLSSAQILRNPPKDYRPGGRESLSVSAIAKAELEPLEMLKNLTFPLLWLSYWFGTASGLMVIGQAKPIAMELAGIDGTLASLLVSVLGGFNAFGRIFWGFVGDRIEREKTLLIIFLTCLLVLLIISSLFSSQLLLAMGILLVGFCFGGFLALYPTLTSDYYGSKNLGVNYGFMFTAYGAGSVLGPIMAGYFHDFHGSYLPAFYVSTALIAASILFIVSLIKIKKKTIDPLAHKKGS